MNRVWRRSETREVRPFTVAERLSRAIEQVSLSLFEGAPYSEERSIQIDEESLPILSPALRFGWDDDTVVALAGQAGEGSELVVLARTSLLKKCRLVRRFLLEDAPRDTIAISMETLADLGPARDLRFEVAIALGRDLEPVVGRPFRKGSWLARKVFALRTASPDRVFDIRPLEDEEWTKRGFSKRTLWSLEYLGGFCDPVESGEAIATLYIHRKLFERLASASFEPGKAIMGLIGAEATAQVLIATRDEWVTLAEAPVGSPLATVLTRLDDGTGFDLERLRGFLDSAGCGRLRALVQDRTEALEVVVRG